MLDLINAVGPRVETIQSKNSLSLLIVAERHRNFISFGA